MLSGAAGLESLDNFIKPREKKILSIVLFVFLVINVLIAINIHSQWCQDSHWHMSLAENLFEGKGYTSDGISPHGKYTPGLALLILPFMYIINDVQIAGLVLMSILSLLSILITFKIGRLISPSVGIISVVLLSIHNLFWFNSVSIMTEIPFMLFSISSLYFLLKSKENRKWIILATFLASFSILIRYDGLFLVFPFAYFFWKNRRNIERLTFNTDFLIAIAAFIIPIGAWVIRNFVVFGSFLYTAYSGELSGATLSQAITKYFSFILMIAFA